MSVTIITGASYGIGNSIARYILQSFSGSKVLLTARSEQPLAEVYEAYGPERVAYVVGDIGQEDVIDKVLATAVKKFGSIGGIVANAGMLDPVDPVDAVDIAKWKTLFNVNVFSVVDLVSKAIPELKKTNGNVVLVSSGASTKPYVSTDVGTLGSLLILERLECLRSLQGSH